MDRRTLMAFVLMLVVAIVPPALLRRNQPPAPTMAFDSLPALNAVAPQDTQPRPAEAPRVTPGVDSLAPEPELPNVVVRTDLLRLEFERRGARLVSAQLLNYQSLAPGHDGPVDVLPPASDFLRYSYATTSDTIDLDDWVFAASHDSLTVAAGGAALEFTAARGSVTASVTYRFEPGQYLFSVRGSVAGADNGLVQVGLGPRLGFTERDSLDNFRSYGFVTKAGSTENLRIGSLDPLERRDLSGPFEWVAYKSKYFLTALLTIEPGQPQIGGAVVVGDLRSGNVQSDARILASLPAPGGSFAHQVYVGPQEYRRLAAVGHELEDVNPYGWIFRPIIRPFAHVIVRLLVWSHETLTLSYGWVLVAFSVLIKLLLWPLQAKGLKSQMAMQAMQPEIKALQQKYGKPGTLEQQQKMQKEMLEIYRRHGANPITGCLPMLLPMPVFIALFFVFQNTIEFRGVPFWWLPDLSRPDPLFITPIVMAASMYFVMKLGQRGVPPNPQAKMMMYMMPAMFLFFGFQFPSGLNVYYAISNVAGLPQQWLISEQRLRGLGKR